MDCFSSVARSLLRQRHRFRAVLIPKLNQRCTFHNSGKVFLVKPFLLADIGEGIRECEIIQWFVEPEARVEEFDKICEVQSDKAAVEIPSRFTGVIKRLYYQTGEMAIVGKPLVDIDVPEDSTSDSEPASTADGGIGNHSEDSPASRKERSEPIRSSNSQSRRSVNELSSLATPAVRHLTKELAVQIDDIQGTGRDGRILKDDVYKFAESRKSKSSSSDMTRMMHQHPPVAWDGKEAGQESTVELTSFQTQMFKSMTKSLQIPHFLYTDEVDFNSVSQLRHRLNKAMETAAKGAPFEKLSYMPFLIKAVSLALQNYPILNARVTVDEETSKPSLTMRPHHNIGIAVDTPRGLVVPVIKSVNSLSVHSIGLELNRLQALAMGGELKSSDLAGGTFTISNIGNIGGTYLSPIIVEREVCILGVGRIRPVPAFDDNGNVIKKHVCNLSFSADHRVIDGGTMARAAQLIKEFLENPDSMILHLR